MFQPLIDFFIVDIWAACVLFANWVFKKGEELYLISSIQTFEKLTFLMESTGVADIADRVVDLWAAIPGDPRYFMDLLGLPIAMATLLSAYLVRVTIKLVQGGAEAVA